VYYWPIDREYKPDWVRLNEAVDGALEVLADGGQLIMRQTSQEQYVLRPRSDQSAEQTELLIGAAATGAYSESQREWDRYKADLAAYETQLEEYLRAHSSSQVAPEAPATPTALLLPPDDGFPLSLREGKYRLQLRDRAGNILPGSQRALTIVSPRTSSVGYTVIPQAKWTAPESSFEGSQVIYYSSNATTIYLAAFAEGEYNEQEYARLERPQETTASADRWLWVQGASLDGVQLQVWSRGRLVTSVTQKPYSVRQLRGSTLGYEVVPSDSEISPVPDFTAFEVTALGGPSGYTVRLIRDNGEEVQGSERILRRASDELPFAAYVLVLVPVGVGIGVHLWRRRRRARARRKLAMIVG
jgi:hypothetical protein